jgi:ATP-dependent helicase Lhr and Lhr-like helicase
MLEHFHPAVARWFGAKPSVPTAPQLTVWLATGSGQHALIGAPTGWCETFVAILGAIDLLVRETVDGELFGRTQIACVSWLMALSNEIHRRT